MLEMQGENFLGCTINLFNVSFTPLSNLLVCCNQDSSTSQLAARENLLLVRSLPPTSTCQHRAVRLHMAQKTCGMQAVLTAPALMGSPTGASAPRHSWSFYSLT